MLTTAVSLASGAETEGVRGESADAHRVDVESTAQTLVEPANENVGATQGKPLSADAKSEVAGEGEIPSPHVPRIDEGTNLVVNGVTLGPIGVDAEGRVGRVHTVATGDTLWDVSHAYLGTAWVWPSVWNDNDAIQNPHLIQPGDKLWISSSEIRSITEQEAEAYVADAESAVQQAPGSQIAAAEESEPAAMDEFADAELDTPPVERPDQESPGNETGRTVRVAMRENMSFVSDTQLQAATSILGSPSDRKYLSMLDTIYLGLGEDQVEVGDEFTLFRSDTDVRSESTNELLGYYVDVLGWAEVVEVTGESAVAVIRVSLEGAVKGDRVMPRYPLPSDIKVRYPQEEIEGEIAFMPASRTLMGTAEYVFVDVGTVHGLEVGTDLEVYDAGSLERDAARRVDVRTPDRVIADLVVVNVQEQSAVAFVSGTRRELAVGDSVRGATRDFSSAF